MAMTRYHEEF